MNFFEIFLRNSIIFYYGCFALPVLLKRRAVSPRKEKAFGAAESPDSITYLSDPNTFAKSR